MYNLVLNKIIYKKSNSTLNLKPIARFGVNVPFEFDKSKNFGLLSSTLNFQTWISSALFYGFFTKLTEQKASGGFLRRIKIDWYSLTWLLSV